jgi:transposase
MFFDLNVTLFCALACPEIKLMFNFRSGVSCFVLPVQAQEVYPLSGQDEHETLETLFWNVDLSFARSVLLGCFHAVGPGRPPRNPLGVFRAFIVMRMRGIRSLREMTRLLDTDLRLRRLCLIKPGEAGYPRSVLSRFIRKVGEDKLTRIIEEKVVKLLKSNSADVDAVLDASFIKAWSTRHPLDNKRGTSDGDARVGRAGRKFDLGYKLHLSIDSETMLPLTGVLAPANQNEKKHSPNMLDKTKTLLNLCGAKLKSVIADSQYSDSKIRNAVDETVIPYPENQKRHVKGLLRVDKKFRTHGPEDQKREYHKRPHIEAVYSFLKTQYSLAINKVRGAKNVASYALYSLLCLVLNREAAENVNRSDKAVSPTYFNT